MKIIQKNKDLIVTELKCFNLENTVMCGQAFRWNETDKGEFEAVVKSKILTVCQKDNELIFKNTTEKEFNELWKDYFDLDKDYQKICEILSSDKYLKIATTEFSGIRILKQENWETLCSFIISQNNNIPRIKKIINSLCENFGEKIIDDYYTFPTAEKIAGLSLDEIAIIKAGFRGKYLLDAAKKVCSGEVDFQKINQMSLDEGATHLMKIVGVGPKVARCVLLYGFYKIDAFPIDVWVKKIMSEMYPDGLPKCTDNIQGIAQQYLFHWRRNREEV